MKSGKLNFLKPSGPLQACNGTALHLNLLSFLIFFAQIIECISYLYCACYRPMSRAWHRPWYDDLNNKFHEVCKLTTLPFFSSLKLSHTSLISRRYWPEENGTAVGFPVHPGFQLVGYLPSQCCFVKHFITDLANQFLRTQRHILKNPCRHDTVMKYGNRMRRKWPTTSVRSGLYTPQTQLCWCTSNRAAKSAVWAEEAAKITRTVNSG
jgi:hypothetical protein